MRRGRRTACCILVTCSAVLASATEVFCQQDQWHLSRPQIAKFPFPSGWPEREEGEIRHSYLLGEVLIMPSHKWLVFTVTDSQQSAGKVIRTRIVALVAHNLTSARTFQLTMPQSSQEKSATLGLSDEPTILSLGENRCGVIVCQPSSTDDSSTTIEKGKKPKSDR